MQVPSVLTVWWRILYPLYQHKLLSDLDKYINKYTIHQGTQGYTRVHQVTPGYTRVHQGTPGYTRVCVISKDFPFKEDHFRFTTVSFEPWTDLWGQRPQCTYLLYWVKSIKLKCKYDILCPMQFEKFWYKYFFSATSRN